MWNQKMQNDLPMFDLHYCTKCNQTKPFIDFHKDASGPNGRSWRCKSCVKDHQKELKLHPPVKDTNNKSCNKCKLIKDLSEFGKRKDKSGNYTLYRTECRYCETQRGIIWRQHNREKARECVRKNALKRKYGITLEEYELMNFNQKGLCAICGNPFTDKNLFVDHCHVTNKVRALLCTKCNSILGLANDNVAILKKAIEYILFHQDLNK